MTLDRETSLNAPDIEILSETWIINGYLNWKPHLYFVLHVLIEVFINIMVCENIFGFLDISLFWTSRVSIFLRWYFSSNQVRTFLKTTLYDWKSLLSYYHFIIISFLALVNVKTSHSANLRWTIKNLTTSMPHRGAPVYFYNAINERYLWWRGQCHYNSGKWMKQSSNLVGICPLHGMPPKRGVSVVGFHCYETMRKVTWGSLKLEPLCSVYTHFTHGNCEMRKLLESVRQRRLFELWNQCILRWAVTFQVNLQ